MKILTVNLNCNNPTYTGKKKIENILKLLNKYNADIIAFNEADKATLIALKESLKKYTPKYTPTLALTTKVKNPKLISQLDDGVKVYVATFVSEKISKEITVNNALGDWARLHDLELKIIKDQTIHTLNILNAYVPCAGKDEDSLERKEKVLGLIKNYAVKHTNKDCIILGDFNTDFNDNFNLYKELEHLNTKGFRSVLYNSEAFTYKTGVIDHIFLSKILVPIVTSRTQDDSTRIGESAFTDHSALIVEIDLKLKNNNVLN